LARGPTGAPARNSQVFINCPFDDDYRPCFEAILFAVTISDYRARCALEENDSGDIRFDKLRRLIAECDHTIHDLSRTESGAEGLLRFNMPFELGLMMGAKHFGGPKQRAKRACIMVAKDYVLPKYLSDLAGNDPVAHANDPRVIVRIVRDHFHNDPDGRRLPGATQYCRPSRRFPRPAPRPGSGSAADHGRGASASKLSEFHGHAKGVPRPRS
jgi:hypothetical protein